MRSSIVLHRNGVGLWTTTDAHGLLEVQLLIYSHSNYGWMMYPKRTVAEGARRVHTSWAKDEAGDPAAVLLCWVSGSQMESDGASEYVCVQHRLQWLLEPEADAMLSGQMVIVVLFGLVSFWCFLYSWRARYIAQVRGGAARAGPSSAAQRRRRRAAAAETARLDELRVQLAEIPSSPPTTELQREPSSGDECSICQGAIVVRVALQRCGHTACRDCAARLVEHRLACHICRASIEGFLPVYL